MKKPAADLGTPPELAWLPIDRLKVDVRYQRDTASRASRDLIARIADGFRWERFGAVMAVKDGDDWMVIDGQHRVEGARLRGDIRHVPAVVLPHASVEAAAADFVAINRDRVIMTPMHVHHALVVAGDPTAREVQAICAAAGVTISRYPKGVSQMKPGETMAIGAIQAAYKAHGAEALQAGLTILNGAYGKTPGALRAVLVRPIAAVWASQGKGKAIDPVRLKSVLVKYGQKYLIETARARMDKGGARSITEALVGVIKVLLDGGVQTKAPGASAPAAPAEAPDDESEDDDALEVPDDEEDLLLGDESDEDAALPVKRGVGLKRPKAKGPPPGVQRPFATTAIIPAAKRPWLGEK